MCRWSQILDQPGASAPVVRRFASQRLPSKICLDCLLSLHDDDDDDNDNDNPTSCVYTQHARMPAEKAEVEDEQGVGEHAKNVVQQGAEECKSMGCTCARFCSEEQH